MVGYKIYIPKSHLPTWVDQEALDLVVLKYNDTQLDSFVLVDVVDKIDGALLKKFSNDSLRREMFYDINSVGQGRADMISVTYYKVRITGKEKSFCFNFRADMNFLIY